VAHENRFGLFQDDEDGSLWRGSFDDLDEAKRNARKLADEERREFFVRSFEDNSEIARAFPSRGGSPKPKEDFPTPSPHLRDCPIDDLP
jgi:hypothetical protein